MVPTRRRVLTGTAAALAALAGCNEGPSSSRGGTVTPVDVPMTDAELLEEAASIDPPSLPDAVVVPADHAGAAIRHVESMLTAVEAGLEELDERDARNHPGPFRGDADERVARTGDELDAARERGPSKEGLERIRHAVTTIAPLYGYVRAAVDGVGPDELRADVNAERDRRATLRGEFQYRLREPLAEYLPTLYAAEDALVGASGLERADQLLAEADPDDDRYPSLAADVQQRVEYHRRRCDDAARFHATATDTGSASIEDAIEAAFEEGRTELERVVAPYADSGTRPDRSTPRGVIRDVRLMAADRAHEIRLRSAAAFGNGWRVRPLLDAHGGRISFEAVDEAVATTLALLDAGEFPVERVVREKERAVARLETVAGGSALQRHLADPFLHVEMADRMAEEVELNPRTVTRVHVVYASVANSADRAIELGTRLSSSLQAEQS